VAHVNILMKLCVASVVQPLGSVPAAGWESSCSASVAVARPLSQFRKVPLRPDGVAAAGKCVSDH